MPKSGNGWKGPTIREIADLSGLGPATVDRALNNRPGVRAATRERVQAALRKLSANAGAGETLHLRLFCESGSSFNQAMEEAVASVNRTVPNVVIEAAFTQTRDFKASRFAAQISDAADQTGGVILISREHPTINAAVRSLRKSGTPVVCITTDLPSSRRSTYVGNDQYAAGCVAGQLIGHALPRTEQKILIVMSVAFRCQQEREMGFRRVLRQAYPHLSIQERVISDDEPETTFAQLKKFFEAHGQPTAIYNVAGGNRGVAMALDAAGASESTIFVGHELTPASQSLLEQGVMDYVIAHDFTAELRAAASWIERSYAGLPGDPGPIQILVHTRYNCS